MTTAVHSEIMQRALDNSSACINSLRAAEVFIKDPRQRETLLVQIEQIHAKTSETKARLEEPLNPQPMEQAA